MIISFTKDAAKLFNLQLKASHSEKYLNSLLLDDWVIISSSVRYLGYRFQNS
jgi:hypothetical protein